MKARERRPGSVQFVRGDAADKWCAEERLARDGNSCHFKAGPSRVTTGGVSGISRDRPRACRPFRAPEATSFGVERGERRSAAWRAIQCVRHPFRWRGDEERGDCLVRPPLGRRRGRTGAERYTTRSP